ncbi:DMSO reductase anchor subunit [Leminorella richardii]|uniref:DMSO reductase anchor subunit n=1 Tax=Leminorella richardii TaxID=158841 RepID=A0A2X4Y7L5_9GAMM|nr:DmsC/YnfH family molybdoenzyme membrane anchor subunit [Leminorella richardii]SQI44474.1 DMSO reductase anchor subunit [Leminorella richardii]
MHELPLVFFTVLTQAGAGAFIILYVAHKLSQVDSRQLGVGLFCAMVLFGLGAVCSTFHLGMPMRALNAFSGIGRSPMSNEILATALFGTVGGLSALGLLLKKGCSGVFNALAGIAVLLGIVFIAMIPRVYQLETVATWQNGYTTLVMVLTAPVCGGIIAAALGAVRLGALFGALGAGLSLALRSGYIDALAAANERLVQAQETWFTAQMALLVVVLAFCMMTFIGRLNNRAVLALVALLAIAAELAGRVAFYNLWFITM